MSTIAENIQLRGKLPYQLVASGEWLIAKCELLKVNGQGKTHGEAKAQLKNAVQGFLQVCFEDGTVNRILKESGFNVMRLGGETVWAAEGSTEPGVEYHVLEFNFSFRLRDIPEVPEQREAIRTNILPWILTTGSGQPPQAA